MPTEVTWKGAVNRFVNEDKACPFQREVRVVLGPEEGASGFDAPKNHLLLLLRILEAHLEPPGLETREQMHSWMLFGNQTCSCPLSSF